MKLFNSWKLRKKYGHNCISVSVIKRLSPLFRIWKLGLMNDIDTLLNHIFEEISLFSPVHVVLGCYPRSIPIQCPLSRVTNRLALGPWEH